MEKKLELTKEMLESFSAEELIDLKIELNDMISNLDEIINSCDEALNS